MSLQINVDPARLNKEQRESLAGFILTYPGACSGSCHSAEGTRAHTTAAAGIASAVADLVADDAQTFPGNSSANPSTVAAVNAFGPAASVDPAVLAAFGSTPAPGVATHPLALGATAAPFTAGAAPLPTAPAGMPGATLTQPPSAPGLPAATSAPSAPGMPAAPLTGNPAPGVEVDKDGLPWDSRIHVESKNKNADGRWRKKKQLDPNLVAQVEAQLRQTMGAPAAPLAQPVTTAPTVTTQAPAAPVTANSATASTSAAAANIPAPPASPAAPLPPMGVAGPATGLAAFGAAIEADAKQKFIGVVGRASAACQAGKCTQEELNAVCVPFGIPALVMLSNRLDLAPQVIPAVDEFLASRGVVVQ